jgi:signal transduction histidine kinase
MGSPGSGGGPWHQSLRVRLPIVISGLIAVTLVAFLSVSYQQVQRELLRAGYARAHAASDQLASLLAQSAQQQLTDLRRVAQDAAIHAYLNEPGEAEAERARQRLASAGSAGQPPVELWDDAGRQRLVAVAAKSSRPVPSLPAGQRPTGEGVGAFEASGQTVYWTVVSAVGAAPGDAAAASPPRGFLVSRRVLTTASSDAIRRLVGAEAVIKLGDTSGGVWSDLSKLVAPPGVEVRPGTVIDDYLADGQRFLGSASAVRGTPWIVLVEFPRSAIVAPARTLALRMLLVALGLVLAAALAAYAFSSRITTPLGQLTHAAEAIARGRFEEPLVTGGRNEIGRLAVAFQTMATEVKTARQELETRVEERTRSIGDLNTQLERRVTELKGLTSELEAFSYSVSHDLRAPLRHITGFATLLQQRAAAALDAESARYLRTIVEAAARMGRLVEDLLGFSRMGRADMHQSQVNLDDILRDVVRDVQQEAVGRRINWTTHPLPSVGGDPALLRLAFHNLVANAVKYTAPREVAEIEIGAHPSVNGERVVYVRDNGVGFDMAYVDKLFGVFQRLHPAEQFEGTGIGLANVRRIVHRHGGRTWAEGAVDRGATFFLSLPEGGAPAH